MRASEAFDPGSLTRPLRRAWAALSCDGKHCRLAGEAALALTAIRENARNVSR